MGEEELELERLKHEIEYLKGQKAQESESKNHQEKAAQVKAQLMQHIESKGLTEPEVEAAGQRLMELQQLANVGQLSAEQGLNFVKELGQMSPQEQLNAVVEYAYNDKILNRIDKVLDSVSPELKKDDKIVKELFAELANPYRNGEITDEELAESVKLAYLSEEPKDSQPVSSDDDGVEVIEEAKTVESGEEEKPLSAQDLLGL